MRLILIGPQGAGEGTQSHRLARWFRVPHVATGELLRSAIRQGKPIGEKAKSYMDAGELVPDELVMSMLEERFTEPDARTGFILDGFPRNAKQASALDHLLDGLGPGIDAVVSMEVPDDILIQRLSDRWTCLECGRVYNSTDHAPVE